MTIHVRYGKAAIWGLVAGIVMAMATMMITAIVGMGLWALPTMIAALLLGPSAVMGAGAIVIMIGLITHMVLSMMFGVIYAAIVNLLTHEFIVTALVFGLLLWIINFYAVGSVVAGARMMAQHEPTWLAIVSHLVFGITLGALSQRSASSLSAART